MKLGLALALSTLYVAMASRDVLSSGQKITSWARHRDVLCNNTALFTLKTETSQKLACFAVCLAVSQEDKNTAPMLSPRAEKPAFCRDLDCPIYEVLKTLDGGVELRKYSS
eukprot:scaffold190439_cov17-Tisochrysis_lutea.AAC.1